MTLCSVWSYDGNLHVATDSRLMIGDDSVDTSVKIITFPIAILEPSSKGYGEGKIAFQRHYGLCAAGDLAPTSAMKESIRILLSSMWAVPGYSEVSMDSFAQIIASILKSAWYHSADRLGNDVSAMVAFVGHCPHADKQRLFLLETDASKHPAEIRVEEISPPAEPIYFGSGRQAAERLHEREADLTPPQIIRRISRGGDVRPVGGRVQFGKMIGKDFRVYAVYDHDVDDEAKTVTGGYFLAGLELMEPETLPLPDGFHLLPITADPFARERDELLRAGYSMTPRYSHFTQLLGKPRRRS